MHALCRHLDVDSLTSPTRFKPAIYDGIWRYGRSKLGNILFTRELSRRLLQAGDEGSKNIYANTFFPGNIATEQVNVWKEYVGRLGAWAVGKVLSVVGQTMSDGAATGMFLAASKKVKDEDIRGEYFIPIAKRDATTSVAKNMRLARELWNWVDEKAVETLGDEWRTADGRRLVDIQKR
ncbi:hypothetical protein VTN00DRAFT_2495 [Thermoascus crustaceus]|uniref:uncharacterized protein n=1 Tax=Thermoascus crustaceus TaxID=5088 RepID=UPI00374450A7